MAVDVTTTDNRERACPRRSDESTSEIINVGRTAKIEFDKSALRPTETFCAELQGCFDFLNEYLFEGRLPQCMLTIDIACRSAYGYFRPDCFTRKDGMVIDQISMNPKHLISMPMPDVVGIVAHEMAHLWMHRCSGKKVTGGYHCRTWGRKMEQIGLMPSNTGEPGGRKTGYQMMHYPIPGGRFLGAIAILKRQSFTITWGTQLQPQERREKNAAGKGKEKLQCPQCGQACWGSPKLDVICGRDGHRLLKALP